MTEEVVVFPVYSLEADIGYSKPPGALGLVEDPEAQMLTVRWLPPHSGISSGLDPRVMVRERGMELVIPLSWLP